MKIAVIKTGGKQYVVSEGQAIYIEKVIGKSEGDSVSFETLLMDDGSATSVGKPALTQKTDGTVLEAGRDDKKIVVKYKAKSRYHKKRGHRQPYMKVKIDKIA